MPVGWCESIPFERLREWRRDVSEASPYLWPFFISMMLTQIAWVGVYQCSDNYNIVRQARYMAGDPSIVRSNNSMKLDFELDLYPMTLGEYTVEALQFVTIMVVILVVTFLTKWFASKFREGELCVEAFIALHISFNCAGGVIRDTTYLLDFDPSVHRLITVSCSLAYFCCAVLALFTNIFPARISQYFGLTNHVFLSIAILALFPGSSIWTITVAIFFSLGLAYCVSSRARGGPGYGVPKPVPLGTRHMNADRRRFAIYEVKAQRTRDCYAMAHIETAQSNKRIAEEAGGEIFYFEFAACSVLVGLSMAYGIIPGIVSACGVLIGVVWSVDAKEQELRLAYSVILCFCGHFGALNVQHALSYLFQTTV